ncbi:MAG TPA: hypothetical protein VFX15_02875 [Actinomycetes bacterium]|nr:hypothetical protein [Actinomycetes bacterium]
MAREKAKGVDKPDKDAIAEAGEADVSTADGGDDAADLEGYTGPDGSKSLGYLKHAPVEDNSGLGADADDAGRTTQEPGQNSGAGQPQNENESKPVSEA